MQLNNLRYLNTIHYIMLFDAENKVVKLCAEGIELEAVDPGKAKALFLQAWETAGNDVEKFTAAHYVARHQPTTETKLHWDETALQLALKINDNSILGSYPSLYLNIAKCYEDLQDIENACKNYKAAQHYSMRLNDDSYGQMIKQGISNGLARVCVSNAS